MENIKEKIDLRTIDKTNWESFRFEEIASKISETVDPGATDLGVYVGLEHLDAEDIHIRRKGVPADVSGGKLRCYPGDMIFGKRRAYQRKAAIVDFNGICSAHAFVLRAKPKTIDPRLFPFFLHSDTFMHRMVDISVGGLSPTINWSDLKHQEFLLPPKDQQAQLVELLWAMDELIEASRNLSRSVEQLVDSYLFFLPKSNTRSLIDAGFDIIDGDRGKNYPSSLDFVQEKDGTCLFLNAGNVTESGFVFAKNQFIEQSKDNAMGKGKVQRGDIILTTRGTVGNFAFYDESVRFENIRINSGMVIIRNVALKVDSSLIFQLCKNGYLKREIDKRTYGTAQPQLSVGIISKLKIPMFNKNISTDIIGKLDSLEKTRVKSESETHASKGVLKSLINQVF